MRLKKTISVMLVSIASLSASLARAAEMPIYSCSPGNPYDRFSVVRAEDGAIQLRMGFTMSLVEGAQLRLSAFLDQLGVERAAGFTPTWLTVTFPSGSCQVLEDDETYLLECRGSATLDATDSKKKVSATVDSALATVSDYDVITVGQIQRTKSASLKAVRGDRSSAIAVGNTRGIPGCDK